MKQEFRIAIFASGSGTNAEEIIRYFKDHRQISVSLVLTNNPNAFVLERAKKFDVPTRVFTREEFTSKIPDELKKNQVTHVVLAGFLWLIPKALIDAYPDKIINIQPALLPKFGGKGMYGEKVHTAVKQAGEKCSGLTIHLVNEKI